MTPTPQRARLGSPGFDGVAGWDPDREDLALSRLEHTIEEIGPMVVALSGGVDSALLAAVATRQLGPSAVRCITAVSPSLAPSELQDVASMAEEWGLRWQTVQTEEMADPAYVRNDAQRCARCKSALLDALEVFSYAEGCVVVLGVNTDDLNDYRPGQEVARQRGARFPLVEAGIDKAMVRSISKRMGLRTWDKPAAACLASRIPHGTPVTVRTLSQVARAEAALHSLGLGQLRVRHYGDTARVEVESAELCGAAAMATQIVTRLKALGYARVTLDLEGFRSGNLSPVLPAKEG